MIAHLILILTPAAAATAPDVRPSPVPVAAPSRVLDEEFDKRLADAGTDAAKLWELHLWCKETSRSAESRTVLKKIVELSPDHQDARKALGHHFYDEKWFETYTALAKYKRDEEQKQKEKGLARYKDQWVPIADVPYLRMGWAKDEKGTWSNPRLVEARAMEAKYVSDGWKLRREDSVWVKPDELEKMNTGLWKCGDQWLPIEDANKFHAELFQWWRLSGKHFVLNSTCDHNAADARQSTLEWASWWADETYDDLVELYGVEPERPVELTVLRSRDQYNVFAGGNQSTGMPGVEASGHSSVHYAFFAEVWFDPSVQPIEYKGQGVGYWDVSDAAVAPFGAFAVRHAAGLSYAEAIDPSLDSISRFVETPTSQPSAEAFWAEKKIPRWLRYGGAAYVERYMPDPTAAAGEEGRTRRWAIENLKRGGDIPAFDQIFAFQIDFADPDGSGRLISAAGLVTAFILDGKCKDVEEKHQAFKAALESGVEVPKTVQELQEGLIKNEKDLKAFAES